MPAERASIVVVAAVVEKNGRFLLTQRLEGTHLEGTWEFPGGKCEDGETHEACLLRELAEELGVGADVNEEIFTVEHAYSVRTVRLHFRRCRLHADPVPQLGQQMLWASPADLTALKFPEADRELVAMLARSTGPDR